MSTGLECVSRNQACARLYAGGKNGDVRVTVTAEWLEALIGKESVRVLACTFGEQAFDTVKLRRVEAHGLCVPFHTDYSRY
jgi:hypothetical protein